MKHDAKSKTSLKVLLDLSRQQNDKLVSGVPSVKRRRITHVKSFVNWNLDIVLLDGVNPIIEMFS